MPFERIELNATLTVQKSKELFNYQQTFYVEGSTIAMYKENLSKTNYYKLLNEKLNTLQKLYQSISISS